MRSDPKPDHSIFPFNTHDSPSNSNPYGENWILHANLLKIETGVIGVFLPELVVFSGKLFNTIRQAVKTINEIIGKMGIHSSSNPFF